MNRLKTVVFNITLSLNCLLLLFTLAGDKLHVPAWIQVIGRMHPLLVHFPIVLLIGWIIWVLFVQYKSTPPPQSTSQQSTSQQSEQSEQSEQSQAWFLLTTALLTAVTALAGILLSNETGYSPESIALHKTGGVILSLALLAWSYWLPVISIRKSASQAASIAAFILLLLTGHEGSSITHGDNYLFAPITPSHKNVPIEDALVFRDMVMPILETKCLSCHSFKKAKGGLILETQATLTKGGKSGALFIKGQPDISLIMQRIHLPASEKKHMPPAGKPQPDDDEIAILSQWIRQGADFDKKVTDLPATDTLRTLADNIFTRPESTQPGYNFSAAKEQDIEALNNNNRQVHPIAQGSPALSAAFYNRGLYTSQSLKELQEKLKTQVVALDMSYMPIQPADVTIITAFKNLRKLNLNFSTVPATGIAELQKLQNLEELSIAGTGLTGNDLTPLAKCKNLHTLYCWNLHLTQAQLAAIEKSNPTLHVQTGVNGDSLKVRLNPPQLLTDVRVIQGVPLTLKLKHYIRNVQLKYTLDGSLPDSSNGSIYQDSIILDQAAVLKARAFKGGWIGSDSLVAQFYKNTWHADSIRSLTPLDSVYKGKQGAKTLIDGDKSDDNYANGRWLGFRRNRMEMLLRYPTTVKIKNVSISSLTDVAAMIMPPTTIELWGGSSPHNLTRLGSITPAQPDTVRPSTMPTYDFNVSPTTIKFLKLVATPVDKLPPWHPAKGQKGWFFIDEIFVN